MSAVVVSERELRQQVGLDSTALEAIEKAFSWASTGRAVMPPIMHIDVAEGPGDVDVKSAYVSGLDSFVVKIASGFFGNADLGLPTGSGLMVVLSARTGFCEAVLLDNGYLTDVRTALAGAVAARYLAPLSVHTVGVIGAGVQARLQIEALRLVRDFDDVLVYGRSAERAAAYCDEMSERLGVGVEATTSVEELVGQSQIVVTTTPSREPLVEAAWLHPGLHITAMGSDLPGKQELAADVLRAADLLVCDSKTQAACHGELQHLAELETRRAFELGEITSGGRPGRTDDKAISVCDLTGMGTQDTAISLFALRRFAD
ncbi:MAG: cyclodeaminase [Gemmatimonadetes bacterium]|nr:cyclodeaminase [Gemmatimonadota bacterium]